MDRPRSWEGFVAVLVMAAICLLPPGPQAELRAQALSKSFEALSTPNIVFEEIRKLVPKYKVKIAVIGSSVKGGKYVDPLLKSLKGKALTGVSDVDMTMIATGSRKELFTKWTDFHGELKSAVKARLAKLRPDLQQRYGADLADDFIKRVVDSINIYPPDELVKGVQSADEYVKELNHLFAEFGGKSHHINLGKSEFDAIVGDDSAKAFRQFYEKTNGVVFEEHNGKVISAFHDLQTPAKFTGKGTTSISRQFLKKSFHYADDVQNAIALGKPLSKARELGKNMRRVNLTLTKAKDMARMSPKAIRNPELDDLIRKLDDIINNLKGSMDDAAALAKGSEQWAAEYMDDIQRALMKAEIESLACKAIFETYDEAERLLYRNLVESSKWQKFKNTLGHYYRSAAANATPLNVIVKGMYAIAFTAEYFRLREVYATQGNQAFLNEATISALGFANIGIGLSKLAIDLAMAEAKALGYTISVSRQDCENFLAGIIGITGAEKIQKGYEIEELARYFINADEAYEKIEYLAGQAAIRSDVDPSNPITETEAGRKSALLKKCAKPLLEQWQALRVNWLHEAVSTSNIIGQYIDALRLTLEIVNEETGGKDKRVVSVAIRSIGDSAELHDAFLRLDEQVKRLGGKDRLGAVSVEQEFVWSVDGVGVTPLNLEAEGRKVLTMLDSGGDALLGDGLVAQIEIPADGEHLIELAYRLEFESLASPDINVIRNRDRFEGSFEKKAMLPVQPLAPQVAIAGPEEMVVGERAGFVATNTGEIARLEDLKWSVEVSGQRQGAGNGRTVEIEAQQPGGLVVRLKGPAPEGKRPVEAEKTVAVVDAARIGFDLSDANSGDPIAAANIVLSASYQGGRTYRLGVGDDPVSGLEIIPGPYTYTIGADGYETMVGNTFFGDGDVFALRLPRLQAGDDAGEGGNGGKTVTDGGFLGISLDHNELVLEPGGSASLTASATQADIPNFRLVDVSADVSWSSADDSVAGVVDGIVTAGNSIGETVVTATLSSPDGAAPMTASSRVLVRDKNAQPPQADFRVSPDQPTYRPGETLTFTQNVPEPHDDLEFNWYLDGRDLSGPDISHAFTDEGKYAVVLFVKSRSSGLEQRYSRSIEVSNRPPSEIAIDVSPAAPYTAPASLTFRVSGSELPEETVYRWFVNDEPILGGGRSTNPVDLEPGSHEAFVAAETGGRVITAKRVIEVGRPGETPETATSGTAARPEARWRNRFAASQPDAGGAAEITYEYWMGAQGRWSGPARFKSVSVEGQAHVETGEQDSGINTGWLLFVPKGRNELRYEVLAFDFGPKRPKVLYSGNVPLHGTSIDPATVKITKVQSRAIEFEWRSNAGDFGLLRLYKTPQSGFVNGGLEELEFIKGGGTASTGTGLPFGTKKLGNGGEEFDETAIRDYAAGSHRKFQNMKHGVAWSPEHGRVFIHVGRDGTWFFVKIKIKGALDFGYVDAKGHFHETRGRKVDYTEFAMKLDRGVWLMPVVPASDIVKVIGEGVRFVTEYEFYPEGSGYDGMNIEPWNKTIDNIGISLDGTRLALEKVDLSKIRIPNQSAQSPKVLPVMWGSGTWYLRKSADKLELRGAGYGPWGESWIRVAGQHDATFSYVGTGAGPVVCYKEAGGPWRIKLFDHSTGKLTREYTRSEPMRIGHGGQYGAYVFVGEKEDRFYAVDIFNNRMREYDPVTKEYID